MRGAKIIPCLYGPPPMETRFFYHSFPRRRQSETPDDQLRKGLKILEAIRDMGLLLTPEAIEWHQPTIQGPARTFPLVQRRACFTELAPNELPEHAATFGPFALEFEITALRRLGAIPVFYVPQGNDGQADGSHVGSALMAVAADALAVIGRISRFAEAAERCAPTEPLEINVGYEGRPETRGHYVVDAAQAKLVVQAAGHDATPLPTLAIGLENLLNLFYPTDNLHRDGAALLYYRQREWRIGTSFSVRGAEVMRLLGEDEIARLNQIDEQFFSRRMRIVGRDVPAAALTYLYPSLNGVPFIKQVRRVIVPASVIDEAKRALSGIGEPPAVVAQETTRG